MRSTAVAALAGVTFVGTSAPSANAEQALACAASTIPDIVLAGQGNCVNGTSFTANTFACATSPCPATSDEATCGAVCAADPGCTGFELRANAANQPECFVLTAAAPLPLNGSAALPWTPVNGTQEDWGRAVATVNSVATACCYKRSYPRPNPFNNPVPKPPRQSAIQQAIFANKTALARAASVAATPALEQLVEFCAANATDAHGHPYDIFGPALCPGMADLTNNGTLAPYPTAAQILQRFSDELRAAEYGHGYEVLDTLMNMDNVFNPSYPFMFNLYHPCSLGLNFTDADHMCGMSKAGGGNGAKYDQIMQDFFGCPPFTTGNPPTDFHEACDRIVFVFIRRCKRHTVCGSVFTSVIAPSS